MKLTLASFVFAILALFIVKISIADSLIERSDAIRPTLIQTIPTK